MGSRIPDRWLEYTPIGNRISGTRFIAFKVPLHKRMNESVSKDRQLTCDMLIERIPNLGLVIDLTNTSRYYDPTELMTKGIRYEKLMIPGRDLPPRQTVCTFKSIVHNFLAINPNNGKLIGVHCTHGVNRTGFLICNFMISHLKMSPTHAIRSFQAARGHDIERENYINHLLQITRQPLRKSYPNHTQGHH